MPFSPPPVENYIEALRSRIIEGRTFNPYEYRPVVIPLQVTLGPTRQQGTATFTIPSNQRLAIRQLVPIATPVDVSAAAFAPTGTLVNAAVLNSGVNSDIIYGLMQNCRIDLGLNSRMFNLFQQLSFPLSDIAAQDGEIFGLTDQPGILVQGTTIDLTASLSDLSAALANVEYGIAILGTYAQV